MSWVETGLVVVGPCRKPCVAGGVMEGALVFGHCLIASESEDHVLVAILLNAGRKNLIEGLSLA